MQFHIMVNTNELTSIRNSDFNERREIIAASPSYILTFETREMMQRMFPGAVIDPQVIADYEAEITSAFQEGISVPVVPFSSEELFTPLNTMLEESIATAESRDAVVVNFDRYIGIDHEDEPRLAVMSFGRATDRLTGEKHLLERQGDPSMDEQWAMLEAKAVTAGTKKLILVDDGVSNIEITEQYLAHFESRGYEIVEMVVGVVPDAPEGDWATRKHLEEQRGIAVRAVLPCAEPVDWVCARDGNIEGGQNIYTGNTLNGKTLFGTAPYFYPFTDGKSASFDQASLNSVSEKMIIANIRLYEGIKQQLGLETLTFRDMIERGFSLPTSMLKAIPDPELDQDVTDYLLGAWEVAKVYTPDIEYSFTPRYLRPANRNEETHPYLDTTMPELEGTVVIMGVAGAGRDTIINNAMQRTPGVHRIRRIVDRPYRPGETSETILSLPTEEVQQQATEGRLLSLTNYKGQLCAISLDELEAARAANKKLVEGTIEIQGILKDLKSARLVMVFPESPAQLWGQLIERDGDTLATRAKYEKSLEQWRIMSSRISELREAGLDITVIVNRPGQQQASSDILIGVLNR